MKLKLCVVALVVAVLALCVVSAQVIAAENGEKNIKETKVTLNELPVAVKATLLRAANGGKIEEIEKSVEGAVVTYSADVVKGGKTFDIEIAANGKLIKVEEDKPDEEAKEGCKGKHHDKDDEVKVTYGELPVPVQVTLQQEVGPGTIDEIEKSVKGGKTVYSADITKDGKKFEVKIAEDGTLIKSEADKKEGKNAAEEKEENEKD